jgi:hypothetical protein
MHVLCGARAAPSLTGIISTLGPMGTFRSIFVAALLLFGWSRSCLAGETSVLVLAVNERGDPQIQTGGPGVLNYTNINGTFTFHIGPPVGAPWISGKGEFKMGRGNELLITIHSSADRPFDIQLFGLAAKNDANLPEDSLKETVHVLKGDKDLNLERFIIYTYDFSK